MMAGKYKEVVKHTDLPAIPVLQAWLADDDLQSLRVCSTNIGFIREYQKRYARPISENAGPLATPNQTPKDND
jgi:hypothetical protein